MARLPTQWVPEAWDNRKWKHDKGWSKTWSNEALNRIGIFLCYICKSMEIYTGKLSN